MANGNLIITADDKIIGIRFGFQALMGLGGDSKFNIENVKSDGNKAFMTAASITKMAWHGYLNWCLWMEDEPILNFQMFLDFMDVAYSENNSIYSEIMTLFAESKATAKKTNEDDEKKILSKKKQTSKASMDTQ